ncbi:unnamed protein product [Linum trigynum]|uniref:F-box domain-containing protein n=1 Tax=Linum trigynum TaxID=586398 RepID=A0AAV2C8H7_9ROSI
MAAGNSKGSKKKPKRSHGIREEIDRFRDVPDHIVHHILSFVADTRSLIRTSLLSKRWRSLWKDVPVLSFRKSSSCNMSSFSEQVNKFLTLRSNSAAITDISINFWGCSAGGQPQTGLQVFDSIMSSAASHGSTTTGHNLRRLSIAHAYHDIKFSKLAPCITAHHHKSLKTIELKSTVLRREALALGFNSLTTLELRVCWFSRSWGETVDPFRDIPCLNNLKLIECKSSRRHLLKLVKLSLPTLDCANIRMGWCGIQRWREQSIAKQEEQRYMKLLRELHNATSLNLRFDKLGGRYSWDKNLFPFTRMKPLMEREASPFSRLRTLRVQYPQEPPDTPYQVIRYFMEGSPNTEDKFVKFERKVK